MLEQRDYRAFLTAEIAREAGLVDEERIERALSTYLEQRERADLTLLAVLREQAELAPEASQRLDALVQARIDEAAGDARAALVARGPLGRSVHGALSTAVVTGPTRVSGEGERLRTVPAERYADFLVAGEGGMGVVYMALDTELNRFVAFKIVRPDAGSGAEHAPQTPIDAPGPRHDTPASQAFEELKARFLQEAWVTSGLEHPGIVPVYELGQTPQGIPYYTMRFVRGQQTLRDAIDAVAGAPLEERLALLEPFLKLCDTVRYAHSRDVVHRDLKPDNVALGSFGEVVLLDWGLAKLEGQPDSAAEEWQARLRAWRDRGHLLTVAGALGTPGYMAPEAARGAVDEVDQQSDVFSLGVLLYEILTGRLPFAAGSYIEYVECVTAGEASDPSTIDASIPPALARTCSQALAVDKAARTAGVADLARAVRTWLAESAVDREVDRLTRRAEAHLEAAGELRGRALLSQVDEAAAVLAQMRSLRSTADGLPGFEDRVRELRSAGLRQRERAARRNVLVRGGAAVLVLAVLAGVIVSLLLDRRRREAEHAREAEASARSDAEGLISFMLSDLRDGLSTLGRLDVLESAAAEANDYYERLPLTGDDPAARRRRSIAHENLGSVFASQGRRADARAHFDTALALRDGLLREDPENPLWQADRAVALSNLADLLQAEGDLEGAESLLQEVRGTYERLLGERPGDRSLRERLVGALHELGRVQYIAGRLDVAQATLEEGVRIGDDLLREPEVSSRTRSHAASCRDALAVVHKLRGNYLAYVFEGAKAGVLWETLAQEQPRDVRWQQKVADSHLRRGLLLRSRGDVESARAEYESAVAIGAHLVARDPENVDWAHSLAASRTYLADAFSAGGDPDAAREQYEEALGTWQALLEHAPGNTIWMGLMALCHHNLGLVARSLGDRAEALVQLQAARDVLLEVGHLNPDDTEDQGSLADAWLDLGRLHRASGRLEQAGTCLEEARLLLEGLLRRSGEKISWRRSLASVLECRAFLREEAEDFAAAREELERAIRLREGLAADLPFIMEHQIDLARTYVVLGDVLWRSEDAAAARSAYERGLSLFELVLVGEPRDAGVYELLGAARAELATRLEEQGGVAEAQTLRGAALAAARKRLELGGGEAALRLLVATRLDELGATSLLAGAPQDATRAWEEALRILEDLGEDTPAHAERAESIRLRLREVEDESD